MAESKAVDLRCSEVWGGNTATEAALVLPGLQAWVYSQPHRGDQAGGDVYYISSCGTGRITRLLLADVAGHGQAVSGASGRLKNMIQRYLNHVDPRRLALRINRELSKSFGETGRFVTALVVTFWAPTGGLSVCNAGHPRPFIYRAAKGEWIELNRNDYGTEVINLPLGVLEDSGYDAVELKLHRGDLIFSYTDCWIEAIGDENQQLGAEGLREMLNDVIESMQSEQRGNEDGAGSETEMEAKPSLACNALISRLKAKIEAAGYVMDDDMTAVLIECTEGAKMQPTGVIVGGVMRFLRQIISGLVKGEAVPWPTFFNDREPGRDMG